MSVKFIEYEKKYNPMINAILKKGFNKIFERVVSLKATLLVPQAVSFEDLVSVSKLKITEDFINDHTAIFDPKRPMHFVTLSGLLGLCVIDNPYAKLPTGFYIFNRISDENFRIHPDQRYFHYRWSGVPGTQPLQRRCASRY